jgi:chromosome segregation ATPase
MANRTEELEKLVVEQALQLAELHGVAAETTSQPTLLQVAKLEIFNLTEEVGLLKQQVRNRVKAIDNYKQQLTVEAKETNSLRASNYELQGRITEVSDLTEEVRLLKQKLTFSLETINLQKEVHGVEAKENNTLRGINSGLSNEKILETVKYQQELMRSTALKNENKKLSAAVTREKQEVEYYIARIDAVNKNRKELIDANNDLTKRLVAAESLHQPIINKLKEEIKSDYDDMIVGKFYLITWHNNKKQYPATKLENGKVKYLTTESWGSATWDSNATTIFNTIKIIKEL